MDIFIFSFLTSLLYFCAGNLFNKNKISDFNNIIKNFFIGITFVSFLSLIINFFFPLNKTINSTIFFLIIIYYLFRSKLVIKNNEIIFLFLITILTFLIIIKSNVNRPDAGLYHLPYISILNENKLIFGLSNLHSRFGHVSIMQYLSALNNNIIFLNNGIVIPLATVISFFYIYFFYEIIKVIIKIDKIDIGKYFSLIITTYIAYKITRYSSFGNDAIAHLCFFYLISIVLNDKLKDVDFNYILLIATFAFLNKPSLGIIYFFPLVIFFVQYRLNFIIIFKKLFSFPALFLLFWLIKNIFTSGCLIYPMKSTCFENFKWTNIETIKQASYEGNAWSKGWPDRKDQNISQKNYIKEFNWLKSWSEVHLKYIIKIIIPWAIIVLLIIIATIRNSKKNLDVKIKNNDLLFISIIISLIGTLTFFFIFPLYRYGYSYIISLISLICINFIKNYNFNNKISIFKFFFILSFFIIFSKQFIKITHSNKPLWPNIYTLDQNEFIYKKKRVKMNNNFSYYLADKGDKLCMYGNSPCTSYKLENKIFYFKKYSYEFLLVQN